MGTVGVLEGVRRCKFRGRRLPRLERGHPHPPLSPESPFGLPLYLCLTYRGAIESPGTKCPLLWFWSPHFGDQVPVGRQLPTRSGTTRSYSSCTARVRCLAGVTSVVGTDTRTDKGSQELRDLRRETPFGNTWVRKPVHCEQTCSSSPNLVP